MPYFFVALVAGGLIGPPLTSSPLVLQGSAYLMCLPIVAATAFMPVIRPLEAAAVRTLLGVDVPTGPAPDRPARVRAAAWYVLHLAVGALVAGASLAVPPMIVLLAALPVLHRHPPAAAGSILFDAGATGARGPLLGLALAVVLLAFSAVAGAIMERLAQRLLGPSSTDRIAALQRQAARLAERNRVARELHDSVGHALSVVTLQAAAAGRMLDRDPEFTRQAITAIETTARDALADLDHVLGLLRDETAGGARVPTLADLDRLLARAGVDVDTRVVGDLGSVPTVVSREAYRIVQEGITNAVRHAGRVPVSLRIRLRSGQLEVDLRNPMGTGGSGGGGGRGLAGIAERVATLHGTVTAGPVGGDWCLSVRLPV